jgi:hypothetical protein
VSLNTSATAIAVSALVNNITFEDTDTDNPTQGARTVRFMVSNGDGAFDYTGDVDPSMGISLFPEDVTEPDKLIGSASYAMHEAKRVAGKNNFRFSSSEIETQYDSGRVSLCFGKSGSGLDTSTATFVILLATYFWWNGSFTVCYPAIKPYKIFTSKCLQIT